MTRQSIAILIFPAALILWVSLRIGFYWSIGQNTFISRHGIEVCFVMLILPLLAALGTLHLCRKVTRVVVATIIAELLLYVLNAGLFLKLFFI